MPFVDMPYSKRLSDLVVHEIDPSVGYGRKCVNVTPPAGGAAVPARRVPLAGRRRTG